MYRTYLATANDGDLDVGHEVQETMKRGDVFIILILYSSRCRYFYFYLSCYMLSGDRPQLCRVRGGGSGNHYSWA